MECSSKTIRTLALTADGRAMKWESTNKVTPREIVIADLAKAGYNYFDRESVLFVTSFEVK